ncbi:PAN2-PAN3 deadenylation complex subunit Pan3 isoform X2 [Folsomia candida]|uniref:PAN2-PAN3 deadenylation complex subunit Pan3 isoform X2 n=1 Tax=Folsomia candida TaxID=158441 RepID=UPI001604BFDF|nr:PAN2-PAN3 deadenylation complex subunit Pan3 isoform X2 [Folsomia candida]
MDPFYNSTLSYVGQSIPQESKLASYTSVGRSPVLGVVGNHLSHNLANLNLDANTNNRGLVGGSMASSSVEPTLFQKSTYSGGRGDTISPIPSSQAGTNGTPPLSRNSTPVPPITYQENVGGTTYFYNPEEAAGSQEIIPGDDPGGPHVFPTYSVYAGPPSHLKDFTTRLNPLGPPPTPVVHPAPQSPSFFTPDELKAELMQRNAVMLSQPNSTVFPDLPAQVDHFTELCPVETSLQKPGSFGYPSTVYKAINSKNGFTYCLRRIHGFRLPSGKWLGMIDTWKNISHTNLVQLREIFTTKAFGDTSLIFVYDYFPSADTLMQRHFDRNHQVNGYVDPFSSDPSVPRPYSHQKNALLRHHANMLPENLLWAYIIQLSSVIRTIHSAGLSVRCLNPSKIILISRTRPAIRLSNCGIYDLVTFDPNSNPAAMVSFYQQEDLVSFGKLLLALACNSLLAVQRDNLNTSMDLISRTYSADLRNLIGYLMNPRAAGTTRSVNDIMPMIGARFYNQLDSANARAEILENALTKELENGRLFRLIAKLNSVLERNEFNMDPAWSETGDRYLLKLFRDYVFHQVTPDGRPYLDLSHVVYCLNRLDSGSNDKVCLMSHDEQSILITTYAELKHCLEQSFLSLSNS